MSKPVRILVVDDERKRARRLAAALEAEGFHILGPETSATPLAMAVERLQPDVVLMAMDSPGRDALEQISLANKGLPRPIVLCSNKGSRDEIRSAISAGVSAYVTYDADGPRVRQAIDVAVAHFEAFQSLRRELEKTRYELAERKIVERAKGLIMRQCNCDEAAAYQRLQKMAMDRRKRMVEVAEDVLAVADVLQTTNVEEGGGLK